MARKISVEIVGDASSLSRAFHSAGSASDSLGKKLGGTLKTGALAAGAALGAGLAATVAIGIKSLVEHEKASAQTEAVLKSTGGAAKVTAKEITSLAEAIEKKSGIDDVAVQSAENLLLTFTNVKNEVGAGNDIFNQATEAIVDMSVAMGTDLNSAAILVGKALQDPEKGMTALTRAGVQFTAQQKEQIAAMIESGDLMGAQKVILEELTTQFGGSAEALGTTVAGKIEILKAKFEDMATTLAEQVMPYAERFIDWLLTIDQNAAAQSVIEGVKSALGTLGGVVKEVAGFFREHEGAAKAFGVALTGVATASVAFKVIPGLESMATSLVKIAATSFGPWGLAVAGAAVGIGALAVGISNLINSGPTLSGVLDELGERAGFLADNFERVKNSQLEVEGSNLAVERATISLSQAQTDLTKTTNDIYEGNIKGAGASDTLKAALLRVKEAELTLKTAQEAQTKAQKDATTATKDQTRETLNFNAGIEDAARKTTAFMATFAGDKQTVIDQFVDRMRNLASDALKKGQTQAGETAGAMADLTEKINAIPTQKQVKIIEQGAAAGKSRVDNLKSAIGALSGKTVTITTHFVQIGSNPLVGGASLGQHQVGTAGSRGGMALVGEQGPELVSLPRGSQVFNAQRSRGIVAAGGPNIIINVHGSVISERDLARTIYDRLVSMKQRSGARELN